MTNRPTTTGGRPIPVLAPASRTRRPGNRPSATPTPSGRPSSRATAVAVSETRRVSAVIAQVSSSPVTSSRTRLGQPVDQHVHALSRPARPRTCPASGDEQRLAELRLPEPADDAPGPGAETIQSANAVARLGLDPVAGAVGHLDHVVDVQQPGVALAEHRQRQRVALGEVGGAVRQRVAVLLARDPQRGAHALPGGLVPGPSGGDARLLPEVLLPGVGARVVAAGDEQRLRGGDPPHRLDAAQARGSRPDRRPARRARSRCA